MKNWKKSPKVAWLDHICCYALKFTTLKGYFKSWQSSSFNLKSHSVWQLASFLRSLRPPKVVWNLRIRLIHRQMHQSMTRKFRRLVAVEGCAALSPYVIYEKLLSYLPVKPRACQVVISIGAQDPRSKAWDRKRSHQFTLWSPWRRLDLPRLARSWRQVSHSLLWSRWTSSYSRRNWGFSAGWWKAWPSCCLPSAPAQWWFWFWSPWRWHIRF